MRLRGCGEKSCTDDVRVEHLTPCRRVHVGEASQWADTRRVHEAVDATEALGGGRDRRPARPFVGDIAFDRQRVAARLARGALESFATAGEERDSGTALGEPDADAPPETARRADDHDPGFRSDIRLSHVGHAIRSTVRTMTDVGVVVGNPKPRSRTLEAGRRVAMVAAAIAGLDEREPLVVDLADLGPHLFDFSSVAVRSAVDAVSACSLLVVASPTYKASYTGLLKSFLDWFGPTDLAGVTTVPLMVGAGPAHALAVEVHLRPVLVEIGATLPTRGLYVVEDDLPRLDEVIDQWAERAAPALQRCSVPERGDDRG